MNYKLRICEVLVIIGRVFVREPSLSVSNLIITRRLCKDMYTFSRIWTALLPLSDHLNLCWVMLVIGRRFQHTLACRFGHGMSKVWFFEGWEVTCVSNTDPLASHVQTIHVQFRKLCTQPQLVVWGCTPINHLFKHYSTVTIIRPPQFLLGHVGNWKMISTQLNMKFLDTVWVTYVGAPKLTLALELLPSEYDCTIRQRVSRTTWPRLGPMSRSCRSRHPLFHVKVVSF